MTKSDAVAVIRANYPPSNYTELREALDIAIEQLEPVEPYYEGEDSFGCGYCGETVGWVAPGITVMTKWYKYCPSCGREIKWK